VLHNTPTAWIVLHKNSSKYSISERVKALNAIHAPNQSEEERHSHIHVNMPTANLYERGHGKEQLEKARHALYWDPYLERRDRPLRGPYKFD